MGGFPDGLRGREEAEMSDEPGCFLRLKSEFNCETRVMDYDPVSAREAGWDC